MNDSKRRQSLCSSEDSETEEPEYQEEDTALVLSDPSQLLQDLHLKQVSYAWKYFCLMIYSHQQFICYITRQHDVIWLTLDSTTACCSHATKDSGLLMATGLQHRQPWEQPEDHVQEYGCPGQSCAAGH